MTSRSRNARRARLCALSMGALMALAGCESVDNALDPDCTPEKAAQNVALKSTVGVGNRCSAAETARDVSGTDGMVEDAKDKLPGS